MSALHSAVQQRKPISASPWNQAHDREGHSQKAPIDQHITPWFALKLLDDADSHKAPTKSG
jgi:hypothetical protein